MALGGSPPNAPRDKDGAKGTAGRYGFVAEILRGYLGSLWLARDPSDATEQGTVFVRHLSPIHTASARGALLEAARFGQAAGGSTLEIIEGRTSVDLVTPFVDAEPLRSLLRTAALKHVPVDPGVLLGIARDVLEQVGALHAAARANKSAHGFGGLQPDSILVGMNGQVELIDAGVSAAASAREPWKSDVQRIGYFAPEQLDMRGVVDARTDVFGLGILLWEAFGNRRLFPGADGKSARERVQKGAITRLDATRTSNSPGVSAPIADLVARALEREPAKRFQTAEEMQAAINALEPASAERMGAWVTALAETAITKRRQLLARSSVAPAAARPSLLPTRPSLLPGTRPSLTPSPRPPLRTGAGTPVGRTSSAPPPAARPPTAPSASGTTGAAIANEKPASDPTLDGPRQTPEPPVARAPSVTPEPPVSSDAPSVTPEPSVSSDAPSVTPEPPVSSDAPRLRPPPGVAAAESEVRQTAPRPTSETPKPPAERPARELAAPPAIAPESHAPSAEPAEGATRPAAAEQTEGGPPEPSLAGDPVASGAMPDSTAPSTQPSADVSPDATAGDTPSDEDRDSDAMDVTDDDLAAPPPPSPRPSPPSAALSLRPALRSSLPPRLPQDTTPSLELVGGDTSLLGAPAEPLAGPMPAVSQLTVLTSPAAPGRRRLFLAIGAALVLGVGVGGWFMGRLHGPKHGAEFGRGRDTEKPSLEAHVESVTAVPAPGSEGTRAEPSAAVAPSSAEPSTAPPPSSAEPSAVAPVAAAPPPEPSSPASPPANAEASKPAAPNADRTAAPATVRTTSASAAPLSPHRPPPSRGPANSGYKPGGI
jgi:serine/threonine protein kinase